MIRESILLYKSQIDALQELPIDNKIEVLDAIFNYQFYGKEPILNGLSKAIFSLIIPQIEANNRRYENGKKGGRPSVENNQTETKLKPNNNLTKTKAKANDNDNDNDNVNILYYLNEKVGTSFKPVDSNLKFIRARLNSGYKEEDLKKVIDLKVAEWNGTDMQKYLRPETLFNATKFEGYLNGLKASKGIKQDFHQKEYTKQELDAIVDNLDDVLQYVKGNDNEKK